jgi:anti-sigma regulatory factor (Ser/Thr protein kinase)
MTARQSLSLRREPHSVRRARRALERVATRLSKQRLRDASLCLSELVTNAIQHASAGSDLELRLALDEQRLRVEVADRGRGFRPGRPTPGDERGWGLFIVENLSDRWGVEPGERTVVWFEIAR